MTLPAKLKEGLGSREYELEKKLKLQEDEFEVSRHKLVTRIQELNNQIKRLKLGGAIDKDDKSKVPF